VTGCSPRPAAGIQPAELARRQREPAAQRQSEASLRHLERTLLAAPEPGFAAPGGGTQPRYQLLGYRSSALPLAARAVAARTGLSSTPVLLAAFAVALARHTGVSPVATLLTVSNRFRPGFAGTVSPIAQVSPCLVDVAGVSFGDAVARAARASMHAYKHAYYDPDRRAELIARLSRERAAPADLPCYFNDRRRPDQGTVDGPLATEADLGAALRVSRLRWLTRPGLPTHLINLDVSDTPGAAELALSADTWRLSPVDMVALLRGIEAVLVDAAAELATTTG